MAEFRHLTRTVEHDVATITLTRPEVMNAVNIAAIDELRTALDGLRRDGARALILTGSGRAFCAGADLGGSGFTEGSRGDAVRRELQQHFNPAIAAVHALDIPVVTAVNGAAAGIGCSLALAGDLIVAGRSAYFLQAFVNIGLVPDGGSTWLLPRTLGHPRALEMAMLGERIPAETAERWGLINWCVDDGALMDKAGAVAARLAAGPTLALRMMRRLVRNASQLSLAEAMELEAEAQRQAIDSADSIEGVLAFREKRPPRFQGQ